MFLLIRKTILLYAAILTASLLAAILPGGRTCLASQNNTVTIYLRWRHQFQFAGYYAAIEKGFYAAEGLQVQLKEKVPGEDPRTKVLEGPGTYGIADAGLLLNKVQGDPVVLLTQIFQHSPLIFISKHGSDIISPHDMVGKTVMYEPNRDSAPLEALLFEVLGKDILSKIHQIPHSMNYDDLTSGRVDVMSAYLTDQPFRLKGKGHSVNIINPQNYGIDFYGDNLFTSKKEIQDYPERINKVLRATLKGWQYAIENSEEIIDIILDHYNSQNLDRKFLEFESRMVKMMIMADLIPLGDINTGRYRTLAGIYQQLGAMKSDEVPHDFIYKQTMVELTDKEQNWIAAHPHITFGDGQDIKPYIHSGADNNIHSFAADFLNIIKEKTGVAIGLKSGNWHELLAGTAQGELDGLSLVTSWTAKANNLLSSTPVLETYKMVFMRDSKKRQIKTLQDLQGMQVGILADSLVDHLFLNDIPDIKVVKTDSVRTQMELLAQGKIDAAIGDVITHNFIRKHSLANIEAVYTITEKIPAYGFAVRGDWPELVSIINKGLAAISEDEQNAIMRKWDKIAEADLNQKRIILSAEEIKWLKAHPFLHFAIDPGCLPLEFINDKGKHRGITADLLSLASRELGFSTSLLKTATWAQTMDAARTGKIDLIPAIVKTDTSLDFLNFTTPYLNFPVVVLTHKDLPYINTLDDLKGKRLAVIEQAGLTASLQKDYPHCQYVYFPDNVSALTALTAGKVDAFPVNTATVNYALKHPEFSTLKVAAPTNYTLSLSFAVRKDWPQLINILEKFINSIPPEKKDALTQGWLNLQVEHKVDWRSVISIVSTVTGMGTVIILLFVLWNRKLSREVNLRRKAEQALQQQQLQLEQQVEERTAELTASNKQLQTSERKFKSIFHNTFQFIGLLSPQGKLLECNDTSLAFIKREAKDIVGLFFWETPWWSHSVRLQEELQQNIGLAATGEFIQFDVTHQDMTGKVHYVDFSLKPILDDKGNVVFLVAEGRDITQQKLNELRFQTLFDTANDAILIMNDDRFVRGNSKALEIFGCDYHELMESSPDQFSPPYQPDGRKSRDSALEKIKAAYNGDCLTFEWQHCRCDGTPFDAEVSLNVAELEGEKFLQAIVRDISERKNAEKQLNRLASVIEQASETIIITDKQGIIEYVNPAFEKTTGYSTAEALGRTPRMLQSGVHQAGFYKNLWDILTAGKVWKGRFTDKSRDGNIIVLDTTISPVMDQNGKNIGYVSVARDMTKQIKLEADLRQAQKMEAIGTLAGGIAHDFNNILTSIFGYSELAAIHTDNKEKLHYDIHQIRQAGERAKDLVQQILTFSRKAEQSKRPLRIALIMKEVVKLLRASIPSTIEIKQKINDCALDLMVIADPVQIHQVLMNLGTNAFHAMRESGGTLGFLMQEKTIAPGDQMPNGGMPPGNYVEIEVSDTGAGMDETTIEKIFEPYFTTKESGEGTGLGLAVVHGILKDIEGFIHVYSEHGHGSTFRIYIPVTTPGDETEKYDNETASDNWGQERILFVDDEEKILNIASDIFAAYGYMVRTCDDPVRALEYFSTDPDAYDMLITDMTMPKMNGLELAERVMQIRPGFPVILCTGYSELINRDKALAIGIKDYVTKPLMMTKLLAVVRRILAAENKS